MTDASDLTLLGREVREPVSHLECFEAPSSCARVRMTSDELTSMCPITGQPDFADVEIIYGPDQLCIESKSLKLYLWSYRDRPAFAEAIAGEIAEEVGRAAQPHWAEVTVRQHVRGGIAIEATATVGAPADASSDASR